jgi:hypothetical protein
MLEHRVSAADIGRLVLTPGYERLLTADRQLRTGFRPHFLGALPQGELDAQCRLGPGDRVS